MVNSERKLGVLKIASSLASVHYGLGFLLGTAEAVYNSGPAGIIYALSCSLGLIFMAFLVPFYWKNKKPIWEILGSLYGKKIQTGSCFLSWVWMVGVVGSQILGATYILKTLGFSPLTGMVSVAIIISILALWPIKRLSSVYFSLLLISSASLLYVLTKLNPPALFSANFSKNLFMSITLTPLKTLGIFIPTIFVTILGMDFHQFIVRGKTPQKSIVGTILAGIILITIAFLLTFVVMAAINNHLFLPGTDGKETIPLVLIFIGKSLQKMFISYFLIIALLTAALGSGSAVSRILIETAQDLKILPKKIANRVVIVIFNSCLALFLALTGKSIVSLIVSFYAIYVAGVLIPFAAYLLERKKIFKFESDIIYSSLLFGGMTALLVLVASKINTLSGLFGENVEFWIITIGILGSIVPIATSALRQKLQTMR